MNGCTHFLGGAVAGAKNKNAPHFCEAFGAEIAPSCQIIMLISPARQWRQLCEYLSPDVCPSLLGKEQSAVAVHLKELIPKIRVHHNAV